VSADPALVVALLERLLAEMQELRAAVDALHRGRQALDKGRQQGIRRAQQRAAFSQALVREALLADAATGLPAWGRGRRIAAKLHGRVSRATVQRHLLKLRTLFEVSKKPGDDGAHDD
jgi:hypothetical protein